MQNTLLLIKAGIFTIEKVKEIRW